MPISIHDLSNQIIPFANQWVMTCSACLIIIGCIGCFLNGLVMYFNSKRLDTASSILILSLCAADFMLSLMDWMYQAFNFIFNGYGLGIEGCYSGTVLIFTSCGVSLLTITSLAIERYLVTNWFITVRKPYAFIWVGIIWMIVTSLVTSPFWYGFESEAIHLSSDRLYCILNWSSTHPRTLLLNQFIIFFLVTSFVLTAFSYYKVYFAYAKASKSTSREDVYYVQRRILFNCLTLTASFLFFWSFECITILYEFTNKQSVEPIFAAVGGVLTSMSAMMNPILLTLVDHRLKKDIKGFFWRWIPKRIFRKSHQMQQDLMTVKISKNTASKNQSKFQNNSTTAFSNTTWIE